jgi:hypothetical protein
LVDYSQLFVKKHYNETSIVIIVRTDRLRSWFTISGVVRSVNVAFLHNDQTGPRLHPVSYLRVLVYWDMRDGTLLLEEGEWDVKLATLRIHGALLLFYHTLCVVLT